MQQKTQNPVQETPKKRGGARKGAGRKSKNIKVISMEVYLDTYELICLAKDRLGMEKKEIVKRAIDNFIAGV